MSFVIRIANKTFHEHYFLFVVTKLLTWNVSGGTVLANISNLDLSLSIFAVDAGDTCGMRKSRNKFAT